MTSQLATHSIAMQESAVPSAEWNGLMQRDPSPPRPSALPRSDAKGSEALEGGSGMPGNNDDVSDITSASAARAGGPGIANDEACRCELWHLMNDMAAEQCINRQVLELHASHDGVRAAVLLSRAEALVPGGGVPGAAEALVPGE